MRDDDDDEIGPEEETGPEVTDEIFSASVFEGVPDEDEDETQDPEVVLVPDPEVDAPLEEPAEPKSKNKGQSKKRASKPKPDSAPEPATDTEASAAPAEEREVRYERLSSIRIEYKHWQNPRQRTGLEDAKIKALAESISARSTTDETGIVTAGLKQPLDVVSIKANGGTVLLAIDGQRRTRAMEYLGLPSDTLVPVFYYKPEPIDWTPAVAAELLLEVVEMASTREGLSSFELADVAQRLRGSKDDDTGKEYTMAKIAKAIDRSESWCSKILGAMKTATPALLLKWQRGEVTDEQFKDLAATKEPSKQKSALNAVIEARTTGDTRGARTLAKEAKVIAKRDEPKPKPKKPAKGEQTSIDTPPPMRPTPGAILDDLVRVADERPPTHDYVRGIMDGLRYARGAIDPKNFGKPWGAYMALVMGDAPTKAKPAKAKKPKK